MKAATRKTAQPDHKAKDYNVQQEGTATREDKSMQSFSQ